ncbi:MarR family winged helix-turn-helix transcriptional regulator [Falsiphaeobacter marinintestinus]|uniref:MarR family winged helix-turn-helix transcriptional regulator n=1 Tax=Falsiphaeobacter marinintestinus TaxID=1492905 RepID=UPI0011B3F5CF|nr:MarR family transcriptional regulator [Phaeobacter marinintestinus]
MPPKDIAMDNGVPTDLPPEMNVLMGVYLLYLKVDEVVDSINVTPDLTKNERHLLIYMAEPRRMGELAADMQVLPSTLTNIADALESKGLALRESDPEDRRASRLRLTEIGDAKRQEVIRKGAEVFTEISGLTRPETETISALMLKVIHNIKADGLPEGAKPCQ